MKRLTALIFLFSALFLFPAAAQDNPGLCPYNDAAGRPPLLPRYEAHNQRLVLVDWTTGADHLTLENGLAQTWILGWSADCRYLAAAVGSSASMDTFVWDTVTGANMGRVPDARGQAHHITWGPGNLLVVETRGGAVLWNVPAGSQITLDVPLHTVQVRNFSRIRWDTENNQIIGDLAVGGRKVFDLATGQEIALSLLEEANPVAVNRNPSAPIEGITGTVTYDCPSYWGKTYCGSLPRQINRYGIRYESDVPGTPYLEGRFDDEDYPWSLTLVIFDQVTGEVMAKLPHSSGRLSRVSWSPDENWLLTATHDGYFVVDVPQKNVVFLNATLGIRGVSAYWDFERDQIIVSGVRGATAFDLRTGQERKRLTPECECYYVSSDGKYLWVDSAHAEFGVINLDTLDGQFFKSSYGIGLNGYKYALSPDGRYVVAARSIVYVWDLHQLAPSLIDRDPIISWNLPRASNMQRSLPRATSVTFLDGVTVEVATRGGDIFRLNVETGERSEP